MTGSRVLWLAAAFLAVSMCIPNLTTLSWADDIPPERGYVPPAGAGPLNPVRPRPVPVKTAAKPVSVPGEFPIKVFSFRETPLRDILQLLSQLTGRNVVATPEIQELPITIFLRDVPPMVALEVLAKNYNLWFTESETVIRVMKVEEYGRELTLRRDERTKVFNLKYASCLTVAQTIANIFGERVQYISPEEVESYGHVGTDEFPEVGRELEIEEADEVEREEFEARDEDDLLERGGLALEEDEVARLGQLLRSRTQATAEEVLEQQIGRARALMTVFVRNNAVVVRSVDPNLVMDIGELIEEVDTPTRQVLLETKILRIELDDTEESFFNLNLSPGDSLDTNSGIRTPDLRGVNEVTTIGSGILSGPATFAFGYIDSQIQAEFEMLQSQGKLNEIASPLVFVANNAAAKFFQGDTTSRRVGYEASEATISDEGVIISPAQISVEYEEEELGVRLEISPSINEDRTVTLKIITEISSLVLGGGPPFIFTFGGEVIEGPTDSITQTEVEDIIVAKDGHSIAIGGLIEETDVDNQSKVPVLGDIPLLGFFFRDTEVVKRRSEIIFLITPRIVMDPDEAGDLKDTVMKNISDHPYYTQGADRILKYDQEFCELHPEVCQAGNRPYFPFNVGKAVRKLMQGNRRCGAMIEIGR